ncbi:MAG TPA: hypothetical protein VFS09_01210 [Candidatus Eisenbacteria bacterium]|nr:hypothetical protein [Candidatus Eisenbacteria bacterium]
MHAIRAAANAAGYLWACPNTLLGLLLALVTLGGGRLALSGGAVEVTGRGVRRLLGRLPVRGEVLAVTLGHVVLARDAAVMERVRDHERVHVRQYALWGPFFLPAYAAASLLAIARRRDPYRENRFERDAFRRE